MGGFSSKRKRNASSSAPKSEQKEESGFSHQTGGHVGTFSKPDSNKIMKRVGANEFEFYTQVLQHHPGIKDFAPTFYGPEEKDGHKHVILQDLTSPFKKPCILDVKIGTSSVGEDASPEKKANMEKKDKGTTTHSLGMRITAMKVFRKNKIDYDSFGKDWGKKVTPETMEESLLQFFDNGEGKRIEMIPAYLDKLGALLKWFESQSELRFYSSSLLFLYDGETDNQASEVKMIDFAHVHEIKDGGHDDGYILGLKNLIGYLEKIHKDHSS